MNNYLSNTRIYLRAVEPEDLDILYSMENDPSLWDISCLTVPYSRYLLKQYIENSSSDMFADKQLRLMVVRKSDNVTLGTIDITDFVPLHSRGEVGIALMESCRGEGYGKEALLTLCHYAFEFLRMRQLCAHIPADNAASIALFSSCGFQQCGLLKDWLQLNGTFKDAVMMQRINKK